MKIVRKLQKEYSKNLVAYKKVGWKVYYFSLVGFHVAYNFIDTFVHFVIFKCDCYTHNATSAWLLFLVSFITSLFTWSDSDMRFYNVGSIWNFNHHEFHVQLAYFHVGWYHVYTVRRDTWHEILFHTCMIFLIKMASKTDSSIRFYNRLNNEPKNKV